MSFIGHLVMNIRSRYITAGAWLELRSKLSVRIVTGLPRASRGGSPPHVLGGRNISDI